MYKKLLYNNDCVLDTQSNKVIFNSFKQYNKYTEWAKLNPSADKDLEEAKQKSLRWNLGASHEEKKEDGTTILRSYYPSGFMHKKEVINSDGSSYVTNFAKTSLILSRSYKIGNREIQESYDTFGRVIEKVEFEDGNLDLIQNTDYSLGYKKTYKKGSLIYFCKFFDDKLKYKFIEKEYRGNYCIFTEFYISGLIRGKGKLNKEGLMEGTWKYYHQNGEFASSHKFSKGKLIRESTVFYEDGTLNFKVKHAQ